MRGVETRRGQDVAQHRRVMARGVGEALVDRDAGDDRVEQCGADRVLEAADGHRFVDEGVFRTAQPAKPGHLLLPALRGAGRDDEHLEIRPVSRVAPHHRGVELRRRFGELLRGFPSGGVVLVGACQDRLGDPPGEAGGAVGLAAFDPLAQGREQPRAGIGKELLVGAELRKRGLNLDTLGPASRPGVGRGMKAPPAVGARTGQREESVDPILVIGRHRHRALVHRPKSLCCAGSSAGSRAPGRRASHFAVPSDCRKLRISCSRSVSSVRYSATSFARSGLT